MGQDPLRADADPEALWTKVHKSRRSIGSLMMDQHLYAGVGNIYRAEALFRAGLSPSPLARMFPVKHSSPSGKTW